MTFLYIILGYFAFGLIYTAITFRPMARATVYAAMKLEGAYPGFEYWREPKLDELATGWIVTCAVSLIKIPIFPIFFVIDPFIWKQSKKVKRLIKLSKKKGSL